jgi:transposase
MGDSRYGRALALAGLVVEQVAIDSSTVSVRARSSTAEAKCPLCGVVSRSMHSRYERRLADLPAHGREVTVSALVRRFRCRTAECRRQVFAERLDVATGRPFGRRTERAEIVVHQLGIALGGRPGAAVAGRLCVKASKDTLLRTVRRRARKPSSIPRVIGIDDWAWRKGHRYGTIVCDLERRTIIDLLPDREPATVAAWLAERPSVEIIARDRGGGYGAAATKGRPAAVQVADRWHLMENASAAFLGAIRRNMREIRRALGQGPVDPATLTSAERIQYEGWKQRAEGEAVVLKLHADGVALKEIVRRTGRSRKLVRSIVRGERTDTFGPRGSFLEPWFDRLDAEWQDGCRNGAELWRRLRAAGFPGSLRVVTEWATRRRRDDTAQVPRKCPAPRTLARLMSFARGKLTSSEAVIVAKVEEAVTVVATARELVDAFHRLVREKDHAGLDAWLERSLPSAIATFARGIIADKAAVAAAVELSWSNGQTEGQICKLKKLKRQMYGRANIDLLTARMIAIDA